MFAQVDGLNFGGETAARKPMFKTIAVVAGRLALPESEDVGEANTERRERGKKGRQQRGVQHHQQDEEHGDGHADTTHEPPEQAAFESPGAAFGIGRGVGVGEAQFGFHARGRLGIGLVQVQKLPTPTALLESKPKILKKAKITAGAAAIIAPPMMDILPWSTSPRRMAKPP